MAGELRRRQERARDTQGDGHVETEAEIRATRLKPRNSKDCQERNMDQMLPHSLRRNQPCRHLDFERRASRAVREHSSTVFRPPVCGVCSSSPSTLTRSASGNQRSQFCCLQPATPMADSSQMRAFRPEQRVTHPTPCWLDWGSYHGALRALEALLAP